MTKHGTQYRVVEKAIENPNLGYRHGYSGMMKRAMHAMMLLLFYSPFERRVIRQTRARREAGKPPGQIRLVSASEADRWRKASKQRKRQTNGN